MEDGLLLSPDDPHHNTSLQSKTENMNLDSANNRVRTLKVDTSIDTIRDDETKKGVDMDHKKSTVLSDSSQLLEIEKESAKETRTINTNTIDVNNLGVAEIPPLLIVVSRDQWGARPPKKVSNKPHVTTTVMFTYSTNTKPCFTPEKCVKIVKKLQKYHMSGGLPDIPYNFLVGGDGRIYEGRGWHANPRTHSDYTQLRGYLIEIAYIGNYRVERPSEAMFDAALDLIHYGRVNFWVKERFGLIENYD